MFFFDFLPDLGQKLGPPLNWHEHGPFSGRYFSALRLVFLVIYSQKGNKPGQIVLHGNIEKTAISGFFRIYGIILDIQCPNLEMSNRGPLDS